MCACAREVTVSCPLSAKGWSGLRSNSNLGQTLHDREALRHADAQNADGLGGEGDAAAAAATSMGC